MSVRDLIPYGIDFKFCFVHSLSSSTTHMCTGHMFVCSMNLCCVPMLRPFSFPFPYAFMLNQANLREKTSKLLSPNEKGLILLFSCVVQHRHESSSFFKQYLCCLCEKINTVKSTISREACVFGRLNRYLFPFYRKNI